MAKPGPKLGSKHALKPHDLIRDDAGENVGVLLSNRPVRVWLHLEDYERIVTVHGTRPWSWIEQRQYVRLRSYNDDCRSLARQIAGETGAIAYRDQDRLNLRRENLTTFRETSKKARVAKAASDAIAETVPVAFPKRPSSVPLQGPKMVHRTPIAVVTSVKRSRVI